MRKINKSIHIPNTLQNAPVPNCVKEINEAIYKAADVRKQLFKDQHEKCAYCECRITKEYNDVEHYRPKAIYYWLGHDWNNLLYSCPLCNRSYKKTKFPLANEANRATGPGSMAKEEPLIINPAAEEPTEHIRFNRHIMIGITAKGEKTIEMFHLNGREVLVHDRKVLLEKYDAEKKKIILVQKMLESPACNQEIHRMADEIMELCSKAIQSYTSVDTPHSGMFANQ